MKNLHTHRHTPALLCLIPRTHELNKELYTNTRTHTYAHKGLYLQRHMCIEYKNILKLFSLSTSLNTHTHSAQHFDIFNLGKVGAVILLLSLLLLLN